jgi:hypothetical protein
MGFNLREDRESTCPQRIVMRKNIYIEKTASEAPYAIGSGEVLMSSYASDLAPYRRGAIW